MQNLFKFLITSIILALFGAVATAENYNGFYLAPEIGLSFARVGQSQLWNLDPIIKRRFIDNNYNSDATTLGLGLGYGLLINKDKNILLQLGVGFYNSSNYTSRGHIWDDDNPNFEDFSYQYNFSSTRLMFEPRIMFRTDSLLSPFVSGGIGWARNRASNYQEIVLNDNELPERLFASDHKENFAWELGAGIAYKITENLSMNFAYKFVNLGEGHLGGFVDQTTTDRIKTGTVKTNDFTLSWTFYFN